MDISRLLNTLYVYYNILLPEEIVCLTESKVTFDRYFTNFQNKRYFSKSYGSISISMVEVGYQIFEGI